jgi:peptide/nickel transport system substrate-binding protein
MHKNIQFVFLVIHTFVKRHNKQIILGFLSGFLATLILLQTSSYIYTLFFTQENYRIGIVGLSSENNLPLYIQNQISIGLTAIKKDGEAVPAAAVNWDIDKNGTVYTFHLNKNLLFHDGTKFTSHDISFNLKGATISTPDNYTYKIELKDPYAPLPVILSKPIIKSNFIGLGNYKIVNTVYFGDSISEIHIQPITKGSPSYTYKIYNNNDEAIHGFKMGEIGILYQITDIGDLKNWKNVIITEIPLYDRFVGLFYNLRNSLLKEKEIRQALAYAIPKFDGMEPALTPLSPLSWAYSNKVRLYRYDQEIAQKILSKSPLASNSSEITINTFSSLLPVAQQIVDAWGKIGIKTKTKVMTTIPPDYEVLLISQSIPPDPDQYHLWQSNQDITNVTHYNNLKIDKLLEDGRLTTDVEKRKKIYADFQRYLVDDAPVNLLFYPKVYKVERK